MSNPNTTALPVKKLWHLPELTLISQNSINSGTKNTTHEANFTPIPSRPGYFLHNGGGASITQATVNLYFS